RMRRAVAESAENAERAESGDRREPRDFHDNADEIFEPDVIADLERAGIDRLGPDARGAQLLLGIVEVREDDLPRHLAVNADWLDLLQDRVAGSLKHISPEAVSRQLSAVSLAESGQLSA